MQTRLRAFQRRLAATLLAAAAMPMLACAQNMTHLSPVGFTPGTTTRVTLFGQGLAGVRQLWTSFPSQSTFVADAPNSDTQVAFDLTVPADVPVGTYGVRCANDTAMSDARIVVVDDLPVTIENGSNATLAAAQPLAIPSAVDGFLPPEQSRYHSIDVVQGQSVSIEVVGHRLGSGLDPLVRILASDGKEVASHDNDEGLGYDCRFEFTFPTAGKYVLEIRDTRYQGGNWAYHLRVGDFPIARVGFPAGVQRGRPTSVAFPGRTATDVPPATVTVPPGDAQPFTQCPVHGGSASTWIPLALDDAEGQLELEPNDKPQDANATELGRTLDGRLQSQGDVDAYRFHAKKGQTIYLRGETRRLASPVDLVFRLLNSQGQEVASNDDQGTADAELSFAIPADGAYVLLVEDLNHRGGPEFVYRVATSAARRDFVVRPALDRIVVARGGLYPIPVAIERLGVGEAIRLSAELSSLPTEIAAKEAPSGAISDLIVVNVPVDAPLGAARMKLRANSLGSAPLARFGILSNLLRPKLDEILLLPPSLENQIAVCIVDRPFFSLSARVDAPAVAHFASTPIVVEASREKFFDDAITLAVENLPEDVAIKPQPIAKATSSIRFNVDSNAKSPLGRFPVLLSGVATQAGRNVRVYAVPLILDIRPAVALTFAQPETTIAPGGTAQITVRADRLPAYDGPIEVTLVNLPAGATAKPATIAEKNGEVAIDLSVQPDAKEVAVNNLIARGVFTINKQKETVDSPASQFKIAKK